MTLHEVVRLEGLLAPHGLTRKYVIVQSGVVALPTPAKQVFRHVRIERHRLGRRFRLAVTDDLMPDRAGDVEFQVLEVTSLQRSARSSLTLRPIPASSRAKVRSRTPSFHNSSWTSQSSRTSGTRSLFALWRTSLIGFLSVHSYLIACVKSALIRLQIFAFVPLARLMPSFVSQPNAQDIAFLACR